MSKKMKMKAKNIAYNEEKLLREIKDAHIKKYSTQEASNKNNEKTMK